MVKVIVATEKHNADHLIGQFLDESHYDVVINEDTDFYGFPDCSVEIASSCQDRTGCSGCDKGRDERKIGFIFRKNFFSKEQQDQAYEGLREAAVQSQNRGMAAGPKVDNLGCREWVTEEQYEILDCLMTAATTIDGSDPVEEIRQKYKNKQASSSRGQVWLSQKTKEANFEFNQWLESIKDLPQEQKTELAKKVCKDLISTTTYANSVFSGICGWFDRYPRIPYGRATSYTEHNFDQFKKAFPFLKSLNDAFKELLPWRWNNQYEASKKIDPAFLVPDTVFTTVTVNKTFRTAAHLDAGDFSDGLSNLCVLSNDGRYTGGYLVLPEYRAAINVRPGDLLLINNHEVIHGNTPIVCEEGSERISLVCYLREGMLDLGSKQYEDYRYEFVESRRKNKEHPLQRPLWNGISPGMWADAPEKGGNYETSREWYEFLKSKENGDKYLNRHHPHLVEAFEKSVSLEDFFS